LSWALVVAEPGLVDGEVEGLGIEHECRFDLVFVWATSGCLAGACQQLGAGATGEGSSARSRVTQVVVADDDEGVSGFDSFPCSLEVYLCRCDFPVWRPRLGGAAFGIVACRSANVRRSDLDGRKQRSFNEERFRGLASCGAAGRAVQGNGAIADCGKGEASLTRQQAQ
jgi:hypothetical protein